MNKVETHIHIPEAFCFRPVIKRLANETLNTNVRSMLATISQPYISDMNAGIARVMRADGVEELEFVF